MRKGYKRQILDQKDKKFNWMVKDDINMFSSTKILMQSNKNAILQINSLSDAQKTREELK